MRGKSSPGGARRRGGGWESPHPNPLPSDGRGDRRRMRSLKGESAAEMNHLQSRCKGSSDPVFRLGARRIRTVAIRRRPLKPRPEQTRPEQPRGRDQAKGFRPHVALNFRPAWCECAGGYVACSEVARSGSVKWVCFAKMGISFLVLGDFDAAAAEAVAAAGEALEA